MKENPTEKASRIYEDIMGEIELRSQVFRSPYGLLYDLTQLEFLIDHSPKETPTDSEPPRDVFEGNEIIPIDEFLGLYDHKQRKIVIFNRAIEWASKELNCHSELLRHLVRIHEWAHAVMHLAVDEEMSKKVSDSNYDPKVIDNILQNQSKIYESIERELHEALAQLLTYHSLRKSEEKATKKESKLVINKMIEIFSELSKRQPNEYKVDVEYFNVPLDRVSRSIHLIKKGLLKGIFNAWGVVVTW